MKIIKTKKDLPFFKWDNEWVDMLSSKNQKAIIAALEEIYEIDSKLYSDIQLEAMLNNLNEVMKQTPELERITMINGEEYGLIPDFYRISFGELIDLEKFYLDKNYIGVFSILYRKITSRKGDKYTIEKYDAELNDNMNDISIALFESTMAFFFKSFHLLNQRFPPFTLKVIRQTKIRHWNKKNKMI